MDIRLVANSSPPFSSDVVGPADALGKERQGQAGRQGVGGLGLQGLFSGSADLGDCNAKAGNVQQEKRGRMWGRGGRHSAAPRSPAVCGREEASGSVR